MNRLVNSGVSQDSDERGMVLDLEKGNEAIKGCKGLLRMAVKER